MTELELLNKFRGDKHMLMAFASSTFELIQQQIISKLQVNPKVFFKVPVSFRLKDEESLIQKAFYRTKNYKDPYNEITDKVGGRIVVLLEEQANEVCQIIENLKGFIPSKDRDFEKEREANPELFSYQSHHYILRTADEIIIDEVTIPAGIPIEIQIRTLLQHAYSELTHDAIYKPNTAASPEIRRVVAKSMALIEMTDQLFTQVNKTLNHSTILFDKVISELEKLYPTDIPLNSQKAINHLVLDAYMQEVQMLSIESIKKFAREYSYIFEKIRERISHKQLYQQPVILFAYWLSSKKRTLSKSKWPLNPKDLEDIFIDLGISFDKP